VIQLELIEVGCDGTIYIRGERTLLSSAPLTSHWLHKPYANFRVAFLI
jgi:hypothetical protein